ncbi:MAG: hypothetical protein NZV14_04690 [Bryobacteraceae bacterium]|nr:hypothetical protein [Bryobacteraceae bacterium]MDW8377431.1 hypothetical protein [Bryobacterales bacterium]
MPTHNRLPFAITLPLIAFLGCSSGPKQTKEAVRQGVIEYLKNRKGINVDSMDVQVGSVSFRGNEADATVTMSAKGSTDHSNSMQIKYVLEAKDGKWTVKARSSLSDHGGGMESLGPMNAPSESGSEGRPTGALPPGHPPTSSAGGEKK